MLNAVDKNDVVIITLDQPYELRMTHSVLKEFSAITKTGMSDMESALQHYDQITLLVYLMLKKQINGLTQSKCDELLDLCSPIDIITKCSEAMQAAFGTQEEDENPPETAPENIPGPKA